MAVSLISMLFDASGKWVGVSTLACPLRHEASLRQRVLVLNVVSICGKQKQAAPQFQVKSRSLFQF